MKPNYRYSLSRSSKKHTCPNCKQKSFTYFYDHLTSEELQDYGWCDRQDKCGHHRSPTHDKTPQYKPFPRAKPYLVRQVTPAPAAVLIPDTELDALRALENIRGSQFFKNMVNHGFTESLVMEVFNLYKIGTVNGCTAFPYINRNGGISAVSLIEYGADNHRVKDSVKHKWLHTYIEKNHFPLPDWIKPYSAQEKKVTALFGEHLLSQYPSNPLNVVEAPKTAIIATLYSEIPTDEKTPIWVSVGALSWLTDEKLNLLAREAHNRPSVILYPDLGAEDIWKGKVKDLRFEKLIAFSDLIKKQATEEDREQRKDLADFLWNLKPNLKPSETKYEPKTAESERSERSEDSYTAFSGESCKETNEKSINWPYISDGERYIAPFKDDTHLPESVEQNLPPTCAPANETFPITCSSEPSPMSAYFWVSGKAGKTYLMPDDQIWIVTLLASIDNRKRQELMREHQSLFLDTYHQTAGSRLKKDEIARRKANTWLRDLLSSTDISDKQQKRG